MFTAHTHAEQIGVARGILVTNATACRDGYLGGWKSWCKSNGLDCAYWATTGSVPSLAIQSNRVTHCAQFFCLDREYLANVYHPPRMSPGMGIDIYIHQPMVLTCLAAFQTGYFVIPRIKVP